MSSASVAKIRQPRRWIWIGASAGLLAVSIAVSVLVGVKFLPHKYKSGDAERRSLYDRLKEDEEGISDEEGGNGAEAVSEGFEAGAPCAQEEDAQVWLQENAASYEEGMPPLDWAKIPEDLQRSMRRIVSDELHVYGTPGAVNVPEELQTAPSGDIPTLMCNLAKDYDWNTTEQPKRRTYALQYYFPRYFDPIAYYQYAIGIFAEWRISDDDLDELAYWLNLILACRQCLVAGRERVLEELHDTIRPMTVPAWRRLIRRPALRRLLLQVCQVNFSDSQSDASFELSFNDFLLRPRSTPFLRAVGWLLHLRSCRLVAELLHRFRLYDPAPVKALLGAWRSRNLLRNIAPVEALQSGDQSSDIEGGMSFWTNNFHNQGPSPFHSLLYDCLVNNDYHFVFSFRRFFSADYKDGKERGDLVIFLPVVKFLSQLTDLENEAVIEPMDLMALNVLGYYYERWMALGNGGFQLFHPRNANDNALLSVAASEGMSRLNLVPFGCYGFHYCHIRQDMPLYLAANPRSGFPQDERSRTLRLQPIFRARVDQPTLDLQALVDNPAIDPVTNRYYIVWSSQLECYELMLTFRNVCPRHVHEQFVAEQTIDEGSLTAECTRALANMAGVWPYAESHQSKPLTRSLLKVFLLGEEAEIDAFCVRSQEIMDDYVQHHWWPLVRI